MAAIVACLSLTEPALADALTLRGDFTWESDDANLGGLSGLIVSADGSHLTAVSDAGWLYDADVARDDAGGIAALENVTALHLRDNRKRPAEGFHANAEALSRCGDGRVCVAFEGYARIAAFDPPDPLPQPLHVWDRFQALWGNEGFEALATLPDGRLIAITEAGTEAGTYGVFLQQGNVWAGLAPLAAPDGYAATGADIGPDGRLYLLERRQGWSLRFQTRVRRFAVRPGGDGLPRFEDPETLLETAPGDLDNMEGISLWTDTAGQPVIAMISDDNFFPWQSTRIVEYGLAEQRE